MVQPAKQVSIGALEIRLSHNPNAVVGDYDTEHMLESAIQKSFTDYGNDEVLISTTDGPAFRFSTNCNVTTIKVAIMVSTDADMQEFMDKLEQFLNEKLNGFTVVEVSLS